MAAGVGIVAAGRALAPVLLPTLLASGAMLQTTADPSASNERRAERLEMVERQIRGWDSPLAELANWVERYRRHWDQNFARMDAYLAELQKGNPDGPKQ